jgi:hypothetical protein
MNNHRLLEVELGVIYVGGAEQPPWNDGGGEEGQYEMEKPRGHW